MAIFGKLSDIKNQINDNDFKIAFNFLENIKDDIFELKQNDCIKEKELAIFFPTDAHQPCIKVNESKLIYKVVVKIPVK